ncbi:dTMP kinase [Agaribacter marinus]|uniref:Thymidylate kinase n=1 Tax=Agaribacter marinus TaxID=1431249 RepID=A0AA37SV07_9ALTE|nr:dTMP kinase [Agaribacter marinus]GLR69913.1 thymidylate kinase [Agaribacter marinus]
MQGKFIVVEGLEGAGKSSVISLIVDLLKSKDIDVITTREPGGTPMAESIRACVKHNWDETVTEQTELLLMYAARSQLVANVILPALAKGTWVIGDRHDLSTVAYQGGGRGIALSTLQQLKTITLGTFVPDFCLYLDVSPETGLSRARGRGELDRIELAGIEFFRRVRTMYISQIEDMPNAATIDAEQTMQQVHADTITAIMQWVEA